MSRYDEDRVKKDDTGTRFFKTTIYPEIGEDQIDVIIEAREGDRLDRLAQTYYDDPKLWWVIAQANNLGKGSLYIPAGTEIVIPRSIGRVRQQLENINRRR